MQTQWKVSSLLLLAIAGCSAAEPGTSNAVGSVEPGAGTAAPATTARPLVAEAVRSDNLPPKPQFRCVPVAPPAMTPPNIHVEGLALDAPKALGAPQAAPRLCKEGEMPEPIAFNAPKEKPGPVTATHDSLVAPSDASMVLHAGGARFFNGNGVGASLAENQPYLSSVDSHTLTEIDASDPATQQIVEVGWTIDFGQFGDSLPHLFVFHWVDGVPKGYNGFGYVQYSSTHAPGMVVPSDGRSDDYRIQWGGSAWWIAYQGDWIGFFPGDLWGGRFTQVGLVNWFGEVWANAAPTCSRMGNGRRGTDSASAAITGPYLIDFNNGGAFTSPTNFPTDDPSRYIVGNISSSGFHYGGSGNATSADPCAGVSCGSFANDGCGRLTVCGCPAGLSCAWGQCI